MLTKNGLERIRTTQVYFNMSADELLEIRNEYGYTREENKLFDDGSEIIFFNDEGELLSENRRLERIY